MRRHYSEDIIALVLDHFRSGDSDSKFARENKIPRTTLIGWRKTGVEEGRAPTLGCPIKFQEINQQNALAKLTMNYGTSFTMSEAMGIIVGEGAGIRNRQSLRKYLERWGILPSKADAGRVKAYLQQRVAKQGEKNRRRHMVITALLWHSPLEGERASDSQVILWRKFSRRGVEWFAFTRGQSPDELRKIAEVLVMRGDWVVHSDSPMLRSVLQESGRRVVAFSRPSTVAS
jgi:hypothetical protein